MIGSYTTFVSVGTAFFAKFPNPVCAGYNNAMDITRKCFDESASLDKNNLYAYYTVLAYWTIYPTVHILCFLIPSFALMHKTWLYTTYQRQRIDSAKASDKCTVKEPQLDVSATASMNDGENQAIELTAAEVMVIEPIENITASTASTSEVVGSGTGAIGSNYDTICSELSLLGFERYTNTICAANLIWADLRQNASHHPQLVMECLREAGVDSVGDRLRITTALRSYL